MACKVLISAAATAAAVALTAVHAQVAPQPPSAVAATAPATAPAPAVIVNTPQALLAVLSRASAPQSERDEAARRLVMLDTAEADGALRQVLAGANRGAQQAVARALAEDRTPSEEFVDPLASMIGTDTASSDAAARALAHIREPYARLRLFGAAADRTLSAAARGAVIRALAPLADKPTAEALIDIVTDNAEKADVRQVAADELEEMTGRSDLGRDPQRWAQWWATNQQTPDAEFEAAMVAARAARLDRLEPRFERVLAELRQRLRETFTDAGAAEKEQVLLGYLRDPVAEVRQVGAEIVVDLFRTPRPIPESATQQLRTLIGDSDEQVRMQAAVAVGETNDRGALDAVIKQLEVERVPAVRAALAGALWPMGDPKAVQPLVRLLKDEDPAVVQAAAVALQRLRDRLDTVDANTAADISRALLDVLRRPGPNGGADAGPLRTQILASMVAWASPDDATRATFVGLIGPNQPPEMRQLALRYFGQMGSDLPWPANNIITSGALEDRSPAIRRAAVDALARTAKAPNAQKLFERLSPEVEPSQDVRDAAWRALEVLFPREFDIGQLFNWADKFRGSPQRRLTVLLTLRQKLSADGHRPEELTVVHQNIGEEHMNLHDYGRAAASFKAALDLPTRQQGQARKLLVSQLMNAYLLGGNYEDATRYGAQLIGENRSYQSDVGQAIANEVQRLARSNREGDPENALRLAGLALKMDPPLQGTLHDVIQKFHEQLRQRFAPTPEPQAAPAP